MSKRAGLKNTFKDRMQERLEGAYGASYHTESFIAAKNQSNILAPFCYIGTCKTQLFNTYLKQILIPQLKPGQVIILDNASFHKSKESLEIMEKARCEEFFLPPILLSHRKILGTF